MVMNTDVMTAIRREWELVMMRWWQYVGGVLGTAVSLGKGHNAGGWGVREEWSRIMCCLENFRRIRSRTRYAIISKDVGKRSELVLAGGGETLQKECSLTEEAPGIDC